MNRKALYLFCFSILVELAILTFVLYPLVSSLRSSYSQLTQSKQETSELDKQLNYFIKLAKEENEIKEVGEKIIHYLPDKAETGSFMIALDALAKETNVEINSISFSALGQSTKRSTDEEGEKEEAQTTQSAAPQSSTNEYGFTIAPQGTYADLLNFFGKLETFGRFNSIQSLALNPGDPKYSTSISGKIYYKEIANKVFSGQEFNVDKKTLEEVENSMSYGKPVDLKNETTPFGRTNPFLPY